MFAEPWIFPKQRLGINVRFSKLGVGNLNLAQLNVLITLCSSHLLGCFVHLVFNFYNSTEIIIDVI